MAPEAGPEVLPSDLLEEVEEVEIPLEVVDKELVTYDQIADDKSKQGRFWEKRLGLQKVGEKPDKSLALYRGGNEALSGYSIVYDQHGGYEHFVPPEESEAYQATNAVGKVLREAEKIAETGPNVLKNFVDQHQDLIFSQYKIHLQPKKEYIPVVVGRIIEMMNEWPDLKSIIAGFKAKLGGSEKPSDTGGFEQMAEIVIYPKVGSEIDASGKTEGRRNLEKLLAVITDTMKDLEETSNGKAPRDNAEVTDLVYVAQSDGNLKSQLKKAGLIDQFLSKDAGGGYSFARGEKPPTLKELERVRKELDQQRGAKSREEREQRQARDLELLKKIRREHGL